MKKKLFVLYAFLFCILHLQVSFAVEQVELSTNSQALIELVRANKIKDHNIHEIGELVQGGVDINAPDEHGFTALHWAVQTQRIEIVRELIRLKADLNIGDKYGNTPLHLAVFVKNQAIQDLLKESSASITIKNKENKAAFDYSEKKMVIEMPTQEEFDKANRTIFETTKTAQYTNKKYLEQRKEALAKLKEEERRLREKEQNLKEKELLLKRSKNFSDKINCKRGESFKGISSRQSFGDSAFSWVESISESVVISATCLAACFAIKAVRDKYVDADANGTLPAAIKVPFWTGGFFFRRFVLPPCKLVFYSGATLAAYTAGYVLINGKSSLDVPR